jgi:hypothetical protein
MSTYAEQLTATKQEYPFNRWKLYVDDSSNMWSLAECNELITTFDDLIAGLTTLGPEGTEEEKTALFEEAIDNINEWTGSIDTLAREDLIDLIDTVAAAAGLSHIDNDGEGMASGRTW